MFNCPLCNKPFPDRESDVARDIVWEARMWLEDHLTQAHTIQDLISYILKHQK